MAQISANNRRNIDSPSRGLGNHCSIRLSYGACGGFPRFPPTKGQTERRRTRRKGLGVKAQEVAQYVLEPFRERMLERMERGWAMSPVQLSRELGLPKTAIHRHLTTGAIPGFRLGSLWRIKPEAIPTDVLDRLLQPKPRAEWPEGALVYFLEGVDGYVKIGFTTNLRERVKDLQVGCPVPIRLLAHAAGGCAEERRYHDLFRAHRMAGEWFRLSAEIEAEIERLSNVQ